MSRSRDDVLSLFGGGRPARLPVFSGLPSLTRAGLDGRGLRYADVHADAAKMALAAASTYELFGFESAVVPFDLCVEAEALGCGVDFGQGPGVTHPDVTSRLGSSPDGMEINPPRDLASAGRLPVVAEAIRLLRAGVGREVAVGAWIPGPFTLAWQVVEVDALILAAVEPERVEPLLGTLSAFLARVADFYRRAGADFITIHDMGGSPQILGPKVFRSVVLPPLQRLVEQVQRPRVVSICGHVQPVIADMASCGSEALSVDQRCDLAEARRAVGDSPLLFGNIDPVGVLAEGTPASVAEAVRAAAAAGADAVWPGCDLWPEVPPENMRALVDSARSLPERR